MHEIGVLFEVVKSVERFARENEVKKIQSLVLQIGELSSMIPKYMRSLYPAATEGSILEGSTLEIELLPANAMCHDCKKVFRLLEHQGECPSCNTKNFEVISGKEFYIKEIVAC